MRVGGASNSSCTSFEGDKMAFKKNDVRNTIGKFASHPGDSNGRYRHGKSGDPDYGSIRQLWRRYKMTPEDYNNKLTEQENHCALCATVRIKERRMPVDHDHKCCPGKTTCGKCTRSILCQQCNVKVGYLESTLAEGIVKPRPNTWLYRAVEYLSKWKVIHKETQC